MATVQTNDIRVQNARNLKEAVTTQPTYTFIGKATPWPNEALPPVPDNSIQEYYQVLDDLLTLKKVNPNDAVQMIRRVTWASGVTYDIYRHDYNKDNPAYSSAVNLFDANFYVVNSQGYVYVCLDNDGDTMSTVEPQAKNNTPFVTSDGYQWLMMYRITSTQMKEYSTTNYIPVYDMENKRNAGELNTIIIDNPGILYTNNPSAYPNVVSYYYVPISGNGTGGVGRVLVNNGSVVETIIVRNGSGYTYAKMNFVKGNCYGSLADLDAERNGLDPEGNATFRNTVIISPPGGWGADNEGQLFASKLGIFSDLKYNLSDTIKDTTFRQTGLLLNPTSSNAETLSAVYSMMVTITDGTIFEVGTEVTQVTTDGNANGIVVGWDPATKILRVSQDPDVHADDDDNLYHFNGNGLIVGTASGIVDDFTGTTDDLEFINGYSSPEIIRYTGEMLYLTNLRPVKREETQSERISFVISF